MGGLRGCWDGYVIWCCGYHFGLSESGPSFAVFYLLDFNVFLKYFSGSGIIFGLVSVYVLNMRF